MAFAIINDVHKRCVTAFIFCGLYHFALLHSEKFSSEPTQLSQNLYLLLLLLLLLLFSRKGSGTFAFMYDLCCRVLGRAQSLRAWLVGLFYPEAQAL